jgi:3-dehydroquinate dehydratase-2
MKILIINGPNLNLLGKREPEIYGKVSFEDYLIELKEKFFEHQIDYYQTNHEGNIIDKLQEADGVYDGIVLNPAAYTHTSIAIADTIKAISAPVVEVHISDITKRESYRNHSFISFVAIYIVVGEGLSGYKSAIKYLIDSSNIK